LEQSKTADDQQAGELGAAILFTLQADRKNHQTIEKLLSAFNIWRQAFFTSASALSHTAQALPASKTEIQKWKCG
jgi:hypothetical protein